MVIPYLVCVCVFNVTPNLSPDVAFRDPMSSQHYSEVCPEGLWKVLSLPGPEMVREEQQESLRYLSDVKVALIESVSSRAASSSSPSGVPQMYI